ncbi:type III-A CRISPR-associated CARF protein Csm6 [Fundicoccus culcitae]|uniref:Csm6 CARF domain-containing protein n=1 Tax=Fundicoccus culcitae TaxID=2969821 RepID=A0ABY5P4Q0_9LACT|nr:hypothetical protein [Fundicoccus culcitae]UUX33731.1 hypothetical protein NRE15_12700 [Fundicoccus culcitae]
MTTLISFVGDTDPIRGFHDGGILHITRHKRPDKIVLLHSQHSLSKHENIHLAINSISPDYQPEIMIDDEIIEDNRVFLFDEMFKHVSVVIDKYKNTDDHILLNLTSGTPQMIAGLFAYVQIFGLNIDAYQVLTPLRSSNEGLPHDTKESIDVLIELNEDNKIDSSNRLIEVNGQNIRQSLLQKSFRELIDVYEFLGALNILENESDIFSNQGKLIINLSKVANAIRFQNVLPDLQSKLGINKEIQKYFSCFTILDIQAERELVSEALVRGKNLAEAIAIKYIENQYPGLLKEDNKKYYLDTNHTKYIEIEGIYNKKRSGIAKLNPKTTISSHLLLYILEVVDETGKFQMVFKQVLDKTRERNTVAHSIDPIDPKNVDLQGLVDDCWQLLLFIDNRLRPYRNYKETLKQDILNFAQQ